MKEFLQHFFVPRQSNNYRARLLHHKILILFIVILFSSAFLLDTIKINFPSVLGTLTDINSEQLLLITNQKRQANGLSSLSLSPELSAAARNKANDMFAKNYWAHNSTDGKTPWVFIKEAGYNYFYAGENLARGFNTNSDVMDAWMASPDHRANILSGNYTDVGFAVVNGKLNGEETVLVVEELGSRTLAPASRNVAKTRQTTINTQDQAVSRVLPSFTKNNPLIDSLSFTLRAGTIVMILFIAAFLIDMIIIERKKITGFVSHNPDHMFYLISMILIIVILSRGAVL
ncbi:MAG: CAP domain-containing protein [Patescibacteria group bacterium]|nr:CAP domain-containing protein [Patescibacteria group bacterium]